MAYVYLVLAVMAETVGTSALQASKQFTRPLPSVLVVVGYACAFWFLSLVLRSIPVGVAYAIWSGLGILFIALIGWLVFRQPLDLPAMIGMAMILAGIIVIQVFSGTASH